MRLSLLGLIAPVALAAYLLPPAGAVEMEDGPAYLTDSHGASGVVHGLLDLSDVAPEYDEYWKGALDWLISVAQRDDEGRVYWRMSTTARRGHPSYKINVPGMCHTIRMLFAGYARCGDSRYRDTAVAAVRSLVERFARTEQTEYGTAYAWSHSQRDNDHSPGILAGHSHGLGNLTDVLLDAYEATPDASFKADLEQALKGILVNLRLRSTQTQKDDAVLIAWPTLKNPEVVETGYCYGQAGVVLPLLRLAEALPDLELPDGTTALTLANGSLRYLMSVAREANGGYVWPHMRHEKASKNIGYGSGTGGIGWAFLSGAQVNRDADPDLAAACMEHARGAAVFATNVVLGYPGRGPLPGPGGSTGFGVCGGVGGGGHFLMLYANEVGEKEPELVQRIDATVEKIAELVIASAIEIDGTLACPDRVNFKRINLALDYGQTGVVMGLAIAGKYLQDDALIEAAKKVADYIVRQAVPEGGGYKFDQFHPIEE